MTKEQPLAEVEDLLRTMPPQETLRHETQENLSWLGRIAAVINEWESSKRFRVDVFWLISKVTM